MKQAYFFHAGRKDGFTFVEVFAALVFLAILVPAIVEGLMIANRTSVEAERGAIAGELAENKLNELLLSSTTTQAVTGNGGDFGTDWPGYRWETTQGTWDQDNVNTMTELNVEVFYPVQGKERSVTLTTLASLSGTAQGQTAGSTAQSQTGGGTSQSQTGGGAANRQTGGGTAKGQTGKGTGKGGK